VVLVDDEEMVTQNLEMLLSMETSYESIAFNQPASALDYLKRNEADVVLSDFIMPEMNGLDLLAQVKAVQPTCSRLLLTGYADKESA
ncbi:MAG: response regulator, partial [Acidobacteria bacterium]|nr:response regulator [Acidobacteriota bacterium]NIQ85825.1 response regulator [Acidobacteriota bacterium]